MKLAINIGLSLSMLALCAWLVWPSPEEREVMGKALAGVDLLYVLGCVALLPIVHFCRAYRWNNLLAPLGVRLLPGPLVAISSVGFMAILALPARLGEFVRPALIRKKVDISASAALGTIAVERVFDGLLISLVVFVTFFDLRGPDSPPWMMPTAYMALSIFAAALLFLAFALRWPEATVSTAVRLSLTPFFAPRLAAFMKLALEHMIRGFSVLKDRRNLAKFAAWTAAYWGVNALSAWVLARGFGDLNLSVTGAYAMIGLVAVGIMLPNAPGMLGQYQWFAMLGLSLSLGSDIGRGGVGNAYANLLYGIQVIWYMGMGGLALASRYISISEVWKSRTINNNGEETRQESQ